jgi:hypothetical protein
VAIITLDKPSWNIGLNQLPAAARLAFINHPPSGYFGRLTEELFHYRSSVSEVWKIGTLEELLPLLAVLPIPEPYRPPIFRPAESDPLDLSDLKIDLDI